MRNKSKYYIFGMIMSMLVGMIIAACAGRAPAPAEAEPAPAEEAAPAEQASGASTLHPVRSSVSSEASWILAHLFSERTRYSTLRVLIVICTPPSLVQIR